MNDRVSIEQLIAGNFVKYRRLGELISTSYAGSNCDTINLFIDVTSALKQLYSMDVWSYQYSNRYEIASTLINMCGHYREFFRSIGVATNIYLIYGLNAPKSNNSFVSNYNAKNIQTYLKKPDTRDMILENLQVLSAMTQFIPNIYFFDIGFCEVSSMIDYIITYTKAKERGIENVVISKDILMLQLIPDHNVRVVRPRKVKGEDLSFITDNSNLIQNFTALYRKAIKFPEGIVSNNCISNLLAMTRVPERSMPSIFGIPKAFHFFDIAYRSGFLDPNMIYSQSAVNTALSTMDAPHNPAELEVRFKAINTRYQSMYVLTLENPYLKRLRLIDLEDVTALKNIINKYFDNSPIDLDRL